eukprot:1312047-Pyramimonas_sp.AAC.1
MGSVRQRSWRTDQATHSLMGADSTRRRPFGPLGAIFALPWTNAPLPLRVDTGSGTNRRQAPGPNANM